MDRPPLIAARYLIMVLSLAACASQILNAQAKPSPEAKTPQPRDLLQAIDQLVEQNRRLGEQNQQLLDQILALRKALAAQLSPSADVDSSAIKLVNTATEAAADPNSAPPADSAIPDQTGGPKAPNGSLQAPVGQPPVTPPPPPASGSGAANPSQPAFSPEGSNGSPGLFGEWNPGDGFTVAKTKYGQLDLSAYMVFRYLNDLPPVQRATDHLGRPIPVQARQDFQFHRVLLYAKGWLFTPKFNYLTVIWTVNDTTQVAVGGALFYEFNKHLTLGGGYTALPGTLSMQGSHPYWPTYDRAMADEFFRPFYTQGVFASGLVVPRLVYRFALGNNLSLLGIPANQLSRDLSAAGSLTWLPTTGEFGPRGAFGDYENHEKVATRFNIAYSRSREPRFSPLDEAAKNTSIRLADSLNVFDPGAFADGVTLQRLKYQMVSAAAGLKYRGFWLQGEGYARRLSDLVADGPLPVSVVRDFGFYAQAAYMVVPKRVELYAGTSYVFSDYGRPKEFLGGGNYYPWDTRNIRVNLHVININRSPVSSTFGFYNGQLNGTIVAFGMSVLY